MSLLIGPRPSVGHQYRSTLAGVPFGGVPGRGRHVARPCLVQPQRAVGQVLVLVGVELEVGRLDQLDQRVPRASFSATALSLFGFGDAPVEQAHRQAVVLVVEQAHLAGDLRALVPQRAPGIGELGRVEAGQVIRAPADPGGVDRVGHRVAASHVVPRAGERRPDVGRQVREVAVVERLQHLADHEPLEEDRLRHEHVELHGAAGELRDRLVDRREGADLHLDAVLALEVVDHVLVDVLDPVVELERSTLGPQSRRDRLVVVVDRQRQGPVWPGERQAARPDVGVGGDGADRHRRVGAGVEQAGPAKPGGREGAVLEQRAAIDCASVSASAIGPRSRFAARGLTSDSRTASGPVRMPRRAPRALGSASARSPARATPVPGSA